MLSTLNLVHKLTSSASVTSDYANFGMHGQSQIIFLILWNCFLLEHRNFEVVVFMCRLKPDKLRQWEHDESYATFFILLPVHNHVIMLNVASIDCVQCLRIVGRRDQCLRLSLGLLSYSSCELHLHPVVVIHLQCAVHCCCTILRGCPKKLDCFWESITLR